MIVIMARKIKKYPWWKFPKNIKPNYVPWYLVLWRLPWVLVFVVLIILACIPVFMGYGWRETKRFWRDAL